MLSVVFADYFFFFCIVILNNYGIQYAFTFRCIFKDFNFSSLILGAFDGVSDLKLSYK